MSKNKILFLILLTVCLSLTACESKQTGAEVLSEKLITPQQANYQTVTAAYGEYVKNGQGAAKLAYPITEEITLKINGARFVETLVSEGDFVKEGDLLAIFATEGDDIELTQQHLALERAKESLAEGKANRETKIRKALEEAEDADIPHGKRIAQLEIEKQRVELEQFVYQSQRQIAELEKQISEMEEQQENCCLRAPFDGRVQSVAALRAGETVSEGTVIVTMYSEEILLLKVEDMADDLRYNMEVTVKAGTGESKKSYSGRVISASNVLPYQVTQEYALIDLEDEVTAESLGTELQYFCKKEFIQDILLVDKRVVNSDDSGNYVYVLEENVLHKRYVVTGLGNSSQIWILDGVAEGQTLVLD